MHPRGSAAHGRDEEQVPDHGDVPPGDAERDGTHDAAARVMEDDGHLRSRIAGVNVPPLERLLTGMLGGAAIAASLQRRGTLGVVGAGAGAIALARAITGRCPLLRMRAMRKGVQVRKAVTIQCTPREVYDLWRDLTNLPRFMHHVTAVLPETPTVSRWLVEQGGTTLAWSAEIVEDTPGRRLRWRSLPGGDVRHDGTLDLRPAAGDRGTVVEVKLHYLPPGGLAVAGALSGFLRKLTQTELGVELARLQQLLETGEISVGARRVEDLGDDAKLRQASRLRPWQPQPVTTAESSTWTQPAPIGGGL